MEDPNRLIVVVQCKQSKPKVGKLMINFQKKKKFSEKGTKYWGDLGEKGTK
jgi:hypothetical protein